LISICWFYGDLTISFIYPLFLHSFIQTVLRDTWNFTGYVTSDSGAVEDIYAKHHYLNATAAEGVAAAIKAGCDIDSSLDHGHSGTGSPYVEERHESTRYTNEDVQCSRVKDVQCSRVKDESAILVCMFG